MKKCIIFDVYGTLISTGTGSVDATQKIFGKYKLKYSAQEIYAYWKKFTNGILRILTNFIRKKRYLSKTWNCYLSIMELLTTPKQQSNL